MFEMKSKSTLGSGAVSSLARGFQTLELYTRSSEMQAAKIEAARGALERIASGLPPVYLQIFSRRERTVLKETVLTYSARVVWFPTKHSLLLENPIYTFFFQPDRLADPTVAFKSFTLNDRVALKAPGSTQEQAGQPHPRSEVKVISKETGLDHFIMVQVLAQMPSSIWQLQFSPQITAEHHLVPVSQARTNQGYFESIKNSKVYSSILNPSSPLSQSEPAIELRNLI